MNDLGWDPLSCCIINPWQRVEDVSPGSEWRTTSLEWFQGTTIHYPGEGLALPKLMRTKQLGLQPNVHMSMSSFRVLDVVNYNWVLAKVYYVCLWMNHDLAALIISLRESQGKLKVLLHPEQSSPRSFLWTAPSSERLHGEPNRVIAQW